jgi:integration host factor subunit alpha
MSSPPTLTKALLVEDIHSRIGITKKEAGELVDHVFNTICQTLESGEVVKISGFGNFVVRDKTARRGRNPQTNEEIIIARRRVVTFKPSQVLRNALNQD